MPEEGKMLPYISNRKVIETFGSDTALESRANGKEYKLFGSILACAYNSIRDDAKQPLQFGDCNFPKRFAGSNPYLAPEKEEIAHFPDCLFVNAEYVLCIDHFRINASEPRSNYDNGDEYSAFLAKHQAIINQNDYESLEALLGKEGVTFSTRNQRNSLLRSLENKQSKINHYKDAVRKYIGTGSNPIAVKEDLAKRMEVWFLIQDVSPTTSIDLLFANDEVMQALEKCEGLEGLIYAHTPFVNTPPQSVEEFFFMRNNEEGRNELRALRP